MANLRGLPRVDVLAASSALASFPPKVRVDAARHALSKARAVIQAEAGPVDVIGEAIRFAEQRVAPAMTSVINASGVVLHTGLGRARLAPFAQQAVNEAIADHVDVEFDLGTGARGDRQLKAAAMLHELTGAESSLIVNNCASAVFLTLSALAKGGEVILSRGQMVEIGGAFRMPDIVRRSGCRLVEVGCTNRTRISDYEEAITPKTKAILRCHPSNFKVIGFVEEPTVEELAVLAHAHGLPLIDDVGSGCLVDTTAFGLPREPLFGESLRQGADLALSSGDKMLGGPQAGIVIGQSMWVNRLKKHPLARAVRVDKLTLAALTATLQLYLNGQQDTIPTLRYLSRPLMEVEGDARILASAFAGAIVEEGLTEVGGGSLPGVGVKTWRCGLPSRQPAQLLARLRQGSPAVIGRIEHGLVWLDPRTMEPDEVEATAAKLRGFA